MAKFTIDYNIDSPMGRALAAIVMGGDYWIIITDNFEAKNALTMLKRNPGDLPTVVMERHLVEVHDSV